MGKTILRILALCLAMGAIGFWFAKGANRGWTKTSVPVKHTDEVTGISVDVYEKRFIPGVEVLGVALFGAFVLGGASFLFGKKQKQTENLP